MSAIKSILVHLDSSPRAAARLKLAHGLAERHDAAVTVLYATLAAALQYPLVAGPDFQMAPLWDEHEMERRQRARALFDAALASGMLRLQWAELPADQSVYGFSQVALVADLLVLGQREPPGATLADVPADFVESVLIDSGKPAVVVPYIGLPATLARSVLVAWKETRESARAVTAALPLLEAADRVHLAVWRDTGPADGDAALPIEAHLRRHGVQATVLRYGEASRDVGEQLLSAAADVGADLLVMGCYGHARAREWVLGGVSRTVLQSMTIPVLMVH